MRFPHAALLRFLLTAAILSLLSGCASIPENTDR